jgi:Arc/MetJ-type ribon-helix-helix transcriptional regulator
MNIEIHRPELEQRVRDQIRSGHFHDVDELLEKALDALDEKTPLAAPSAATANNLVELFEPIRGLLTDEEIDVMFSRNPSTGRPLDLA